MMSAMPKATPAVAICTTGRDHEAAACDPESLAANRRGKKEVLPVVFIFIAAYNSLDANYVATFVR